METNKAALPTNMASTGEGGRAVMAPVRTVVRQPTARKPVGVEAESYNHVLDYIFYWKGQSNAKFRLTLTMDDKPIVPGQPLSFSYTITTLTKTLDLGAVTVSLFLVDDDGNPPYGFMNPVWTFPVAKDVIAGLQSYQPYTSQLDNVVPLASQQSPIYQIGNHLLALYLTGTGSDGGRQASNIEQLNVMREKLDDSWWEWGIPNNQTVQWKNDTYPLQGTLHNRFIDIPFKIKTSLNADLTLVENSVADGVVTTFGPAVVAGLAQPEQGKGGDAAVNWNMLKLQKGWKWNITGIYQINGDLVRTYFYSVLLDKLTDNWGNSYPSFEVSAVSVTVRVSQQKIDAAHAANTLFGIWAAESALALAFSWCAPWCNIVPTLLAGAALTSLGIAGKIADDPPAPDPLYRKPVEVHVPDLPSLLWTDDRLRDFASAFQFIVRMLANIDALSTVENRLVSARLAHDDVAMEMHTSKYRQILSELSADSLKVQEAAARAAPLMDSQIDMNRTTAPAAEVQSVSTDPRQLAAVARYAPLTLADLIAPSHNLEVAAASVRRLALTVEQNAARVLNL